MFEGLLSNTRYRIRYVNGLYAFMYILWAWCFPWDVRAEGLESGGSKVGRAGVPSKS